MSVQDNSFLQRPREAIQCLLIGLCCLWQLGVGLLGLLCFLVFIRGLRYSVWQIFLTGISLAVYSCFLMEWQAHFTLSFLKLIDDGFVDHLMFWKTLFTQGFPVALGVAYQQAFYYLVGFPLLLASVLGMTEWIPNSTHEWELKAIQRGKALSYRNPWHKRLTRQNKKNEDGTLLGISATKEAVIIPDAAVNQMALVLGTTGGGKTITLRRFYQRALQKTYPLIIVDGKPTQENVTWLQKKSQDYQRAFYGFNCGDYHHYDPLAHGGYTELKDKLISLKDHWENDYYRSIAEDYLQTTFEVLLTLKKNFDLKTIVNCLDFQELALKTRAITDQSLKKRVSRLQRYDTKDITGLQAHLNLLIYSELGIFFEKTKNTFNLAEVIQSGSIVYFALPALRFPSFAKVLGKLIINDIKAVIDRLETKQRIFTIFDEFSVFAGEQVLNLVNMGRGKGIHAIFGTQGLADLKRVDTDFEKQVLNCVNTLICHRLNDHESAESIACWVGTQDGFDITAQISEDASTGMGSVKRNKSFIIHPDSIKQDLQPGEAFYISKVGKFFWQKVKVTYS
ncbi:type IV secretory pathway VirD4 components-like protein [Candidatus Rickettsiella viridis]|uniref:Type IV secretory pathway VirD4 components-like protein n=1 Tax=Candidatus Rickettsiella viridis TaxID=676208 RepID=A0A2Z5UUZ4_9COXI|nr:type IV secretion system DNA-binding domain-containing protein [Candidatus Rickettsiella viridis]BBB14770.1 type IV secretory pathway VirD4 components-like protein [Candidatus Rickettsiella viridis]BBB15500.1 type IV secretory pathway VirD4 components-like protein [Candidatus Rickettsiella viridis]